MNWNGWAASCSGPPSKWRSTATCRSGTAPSTVVRCRSNRCPAARGEQLGILARLAVAALVDTQDAVPVMIDDALGFSDPERLARMGAVFDTVGADGQVIVLTCAADRYSGVSTAHTVELSVS